MIQRELRRDGYADI